MGAQAIRGEKILKRGADAIPFVNQDLLEKGLLRQIQITRERLLANQFGVEFPGRLYFQDGEPARLDEMGERSRMEIIEMLRVYGRGQGTQSENVEALAARAGGDKKSARGEKPGALAHEIHR